MYITATTVTATKGSAPFIYSLPNFPIRLNKDVKNSCTRQNSFAREGVPPASGITRALVRFGLVFGVGRCSAKPNLFSDPIEMHGSTPSLSSPQHHLYHLSDRRVRLPLTQSFPEREDKERSATQPPFELLPMQRLQPPPRWPLPPWRRLRARRARKMERKARA